MQHASLKCQKNFPLFCSVVFLHVIFIKDIWSVLDHNARTLSNWHLSDGICWQLVPWPAVLLLESQTGLSLFVSWSILCHSTLLKTLLQATYIQVNKALHLLNKKKMNSNNSAWVKFRKHRWPFGVFIKIVSVKGLSTELTVWIKQPSIVFKDLSAQKVAVILVLSFLNVTVMKGN